MIEHCLEKWINNQVHKVRKWLYLHHSDKHCFMNSMIALDHKSRHAFKMIMTQDPRLSDLCIENQTPCCCHVLRREKWFLLRNKAIRVEGLTLGRPNRAKQKAHWLGIRAHSACRLRFCAVTVQLPGLISSPVRAMRSRWITLPCCDRPILQGQSHANCLWLRWDAETESASSGAPSCTVQIKYNESHAVRWWLCELTFLLCLLLFIVSELLQYTFEMKDVYTPHQQV